jgi:hypothetical protein
MTAYRFIHQGPRRCGTKPGAEKFTATQQAAAADRTAPPLILMRDGVWLVVEHLRPKPREV